MRTIRTVAEETMLASSAAPGGRRHGTPISDATMAAPSPPRAGRMLPSRASSPRATTSQAPFGISPAAASSASAMGRSYALPDLGRSAGARFTVTVLGGNR